MGSRPLFSAFGIPVTIDPFFLIAAYLLYNLAGGGRRGLYTVLAILVFVVVHEFGHALTAKAFGATAAITITFMAGFASYSAPRQLKPWQSNLISVMGPATEFLLAVPLLIVSQRMFQNATTPDQENAAFDLYQAIGWAGILLAVTNLVPLWPLDGGHIAERAVVRLFGNRAAKAFAIWSLGAAGALLVVSLTMSDRLGYVDHAMQRMSNGVLGSPLQGIWSVVQATPAFLLQAFFIPLFCVFGSITRLRSINFGQARFQAQNVPSKREMSHSEAIRATRQAERESWLSGHIGAFPRGWEPSPWVRAHVDLLTGQVEAARAHLARLADSPVGAGRRWLLDRVDRPEIGYLLEYVPAGAVSSLAVLEARVHHGSPEDLVALATTLFAEERSAEPLYLGAAGLAQRGLGDEAMQWLERAVAVSPDPQRMSTDREFHSLHSRSEFQQLLGRAERAAGLVR